MDGRATPSLCPPSSLLIQYMGTASNHSCLFFLLRLRTFFLGPTWKPSHHPIRPTHTSIHFLFLLFNQEGRGPPHTWGVLAHAPYHNHSRFIQDSFIHSIHSFIHSFIPGGSSPTHPTTTIYSSTPPPLQNHLLTHPSPLGQTRTQTPYATVDDVIRMEFEMYNLIGRDNHVT